MTKQEKLKHCVGCTENFYNGNNPLGVKECWMLKSAKLVTRYRTGIWTRPTESHAFTKVKVFQCRHEKGYALCSQLPEFIDPKTLKLRAFSAESAASALD